MLSLFELSQLAEREFSVEETRQDLNRLVDIFLQREDQALALDVAFVKERGLPLSIAKQQKIFFVDDELTLDEIPEEFHNETFGFVRNKHYVYAGRLVYPVFDVKGDVMGFCGWDKFCDEKSPKYLDSKNHGYKAKYTTFYGMEMLEAYYKNNKPIYVTEGIVCCLYLRSKGLQAVALLGSGLTSYVIQIFKRIENRLIFIPDNDAFGKTVETISADLAGEHFVQQCKRHFTKSTIIQSKVAKDIDDSRLIEDGKYEEQLLKDLDIVAKCRFMKFDTIRVR